MRNKSSRLSISRQNETAESRNKSFLHQFLKTLLFSNSDENWKIFCIPIKKTWTIKTQIIISLLILYIISFIVIAIVILVNFPHFS